MKYIGYYVKGLNYWHLAAIASNLNDSTSAAIRLGIKRALGASYGSGWIEITSDELETFGEHIPFEEETPDEDAERRR